MDIPGDALAPDVDAVVAACWAVLRQTPSAVVTDIDGTISAIAPTPAEAMVDPGAKAALGSARRERLAAVAVVSGRAPQDGAAMVGLPELTYVGNHGLERIARGDALDASGGRGGAAGHRRRAGGDRERGARGGRRALAPRREQGGHRHDPLPACARSDRGRRAAGAAGARGGRPARSAPDARAHDLRSASRRWRSTRGRPSASWRRISVCAASSSSATTSPTSMPFAPCASCGRPARRRRCGSACSARTHRPPCWPRST